MEETAELTADGVAVKVVRHTDEETAASVRQHLADAADAFHTARADAIPDHAAKFDEAIAAAVSCVDELARPHTPRQGD